MAVAVEVMCSDTVAMQAVKGRRESKACVSLCGVL